jgi:formate/nitrite transporter FocA (FNT family)
MAVRRDDDEVRSRSAPTGAVVYKAVFSEGSDELERQTSALAWSGFAAGLSMGFSFAGEALLRSVLPDAPWRPAVAKFGYTLGFLFVVLGRQQLFTENTLTVILPLLRRRSARLFANVGRLWATVLAANLCGAAIFAWAAASSSVFEPPVRDAFRQIGLEALSPPAGLVLLRGIYAGWLIALMVWLLPFAETARVWVIVIITYIVGLAGFSHVIVGSVETLYVVFSGERSFWAYLAGYLAPSFAGNVIGGVSIVAAIAHAQYIGGGEAEDV